MSRRWETFNEGGRSIGRAFARAATEYASPRNSRPPKHPVSSECNLLIAKWFLSATAYTLRLLCTESVLGEGGSTLEFRLRITRAYRSFAPDDSLWITVPRSILEFPTFSQGLVPISLVYRRSLTKGTSGFRVSHCTMFNKLYIGKFN